MQLFGNVAPVSSLLFKKAGNLRFRAKKKKKKTDLKMLTQHFQTKQNSSVDSTWPVYQAFGFETTMAR